MMNEDITFCSNIRCDRKTCERNPINIRHFDICHSIAELENTEYCPRFNNHNNSLKMTKKLDELLKKRTRLAEHLIDVCSEVDNELIRLGLNLCSEELRDSTATGCMIYCEPRSAENNVRRTIAELEVQNESKN